MQSKLIYVLLGLAMIFPTSNSWTALPGHKRTILTSGEKVHSIRVQLGQSTVIYFGFRPETVICGNKNYFNIEKIKDGLTIQPLAGYSTNLTVIHKGRRYLFYLTPSGGQTPDGFVEVRWIPLDEITAMSPRGNDLSTTLRDLNQRVTLSPGLIVTILREKSLISRKQKILEVSLKNFGTKPIQTGAVAIVAVQKNQLAPGQVTVWETDSVVGNREVSGRVIVSETEEKDLNLVIGFGGRNTNVVLKAGKH